MDCNLKALDLFCGAGGASVGLHEAGFMVYGVDHLFHLEYPFLSHFRLADVRHLSPNGISKFDFIWASPPCQAYTRQTIHLRRQGRNYADLIDQTRHLLLSAGKPFVIENVPGAPLRRDLMLCGEMFGLRVIRHRYFEIHGFRVPQSVHPKHKGKSTSNNNPSGYYYTVTGHNTCNGSIANWQKAMGINWITNKKMLAQAVPPKYARYIGKAFISGK